MRCVSDGMERTPSRSAANTKLRLCARRNSSMVTLCTTESSRSSSARTRRSLHGLPERLLLVIEVADVLAVDQPIEDELLHGIDRIIRFV